MKLMPCNYKRQKSPPLVARKSQSSHLDHPCVSPKPGHGQSKSPKPLRANQRKLDFIKTVHQIPPIEDHPNICHWLYVISLYAQFQQWNVSTMVMSCMSHHLLLSWSLWKMRSRIWYLAEQGCCSWSGSRTQQYLSGFETLPASTS